MIGSSGIPSRNTRSHPGRHDVVVDVEEVRHSAAVGSRSGPLTRGPERLRSYNAVAWNSAVRADSPPALVAVNW